MDAITFVRTCFIAGIGAGILFESVPYFKDRYVAYGTRSRRTATAKSPLSLFDQLFAYPVPHSWFLHYYVLSLSLSFFWGYQLFTRGSVITWLASHANQNVEDSMSIERIWLAWFLLAFQGYRRLHESIICSKASSSTMPLSIYLIGLMYYLGDSIAIWIEGSATILHAQPSSLQETWLRLKFLLSSVKIITVLPIFILASGVQNDCHRYLASLKKYSLPVHPVFNDVVCPHYLMECMIYLSLAVLAAPKGQIVNKTVLTVFLFTTVNLGTAAKGAKEWSIEKFGKEVESRWRMIPGLW